MKLVIEIVRPIVWLFCRLCFRIRFHGVDNVPSNGACIIAPNHVTYADPIWITLPIKRRVYYMAWDKPFEIPVLGFLMRSFGAFPVKLESIDPKAQREAVDLLKTGRALVIFPEGGRARGRRIEPFKMGAFRLALTHGVPIVPVSVAGAFDVWPAGRILPRPGRLTITFHPPVPVDAFPAGASKTELRERATELSEIIRRAVSSALPESDLVDQKARAASP